MRRPACSGLRRRCLTSSPLSSEGDKGGSRGGDSPEVTELEAARRPAAVLFPSGPLSISHPLPFTASSPEHEAWRVLRALLKCTFTSHLPGRLLSSLHRGPPPRQALPHPPPRGPCLTPPPPSGSSAGVVGGPELPSRRSFSDWPDVRTTDGGEDAARPSGESRPRSRVRGTVGGLSKVNVVSVIGALSS